MKIVTNVCCVDISVIYTEVMKCEMIRKLYDFIYIIRIAEYGEYCQNVSNFLIKCKNIQFQRTKL